MYIYFVGESMRMLFLIFFVNGMMISQCQAPVKHLRFQNLMDVELKALHYIKHTLQERVNFLQQFTRRFVKLISAISGGVFKDDYLNSPLPALVLIRRLLEEWAPLACMLPGDHGLFRLGLGETRWPSSQNLESAALTVLRAQWTYDLDIAQMANGVVAGKPVLFNVTAADCFYIASACRKYNFIDEAYEWLNQAIHKNKIEDSSISNESVLEAIAHLMCSSGDTRSSQSIYVQLLRKRFLPKITDNEDISRMIFHDCSEINLLMEDHKDQDLYANVGKYELQLHRKLCIKEENYLGDLRCRYVHYQQPHLRFQPFKLEELQKDPPVLRFYDVISNSEGDILKEFSKKEMENSGTFNVDGTTGISNYRTSRIGWIFPGELEVGDRLTSRIADMTQLNVETAEALQISRYSISGEYLPHHDYLRYGGIPFERDRIASLMYYLNDVKEGGNTIFLLWNLTVKPIKNSAVLWFNHLPSGEMDVTSLHSGCPVLQGTKWVLNKWFHNEGHEFQKHCGLSPNDSFSQYYF